MIYITLHSNLGRFHDAGAFLNHERFGPLRYAHARFLSWLPHGCDVTSPCMLLLLLHSESLPTPALLLGLHLGRHGQQGDRPHPQRCKQVAHAGGAGGCGTGCQAALMTRPVTGHTGRANRPSSCPAPPVGSACSSTSASVQLCAQQRTQVRIVTCCCWIQDRCMSLAARKLMKTSCMTPAAPSASAESETRREEKASSSHGVPVACA